MPGIIHETLRELPHHNLSLVIVLMQHFGIRVRPEAKVVATDTNLTWTVPPRPKENLADAVFLVHDDHGPVTALIFEPQTTAPDARKLAVLPVYVAVAHATHLCPTHLIVAATTRPAQRTSAEPIDIGQYTATMNVLGPDSALRACW